MPLLQSAPSLQASSRLLAATEGSYARPKWCVGTVDVPGSPAAQGTASAFAQLALLLNATIFGVQDVEIPKYTCPDGVTCVDQDELLPNMLSSACDVAVMHEWRSPIHLINTGNARSDSMVRLVNVHGGLNFATSWRNHSKFHVWLKYVIEDTAEAAAMYEADHVIFPSHWMQRWTCENQGFCDATRASVLPNVIKQVTSRQVMRVAQLRPVQSFAYVGAVNDRKGIDVAIESVCALDTTLHIFGSLQRLDDRGMDASRFINDAFSHCQAKLIVYGAVVGSEVWPRLQALHALLLNPSQLENQPTVVFEAAEYGVPMLALRIGPLEEMLLNIETVTARDAAEFRHRVRAIFAAGEHYTPALHEEVLAGSDMWRRFRPAPRASNMVVVTDRVLLPPAATNGALPPLLAHLPHDDTLVLVLPSAEFVPNNASDPIVVDTLAARAFAPALTLTMNGKVETHRVQPPFFVAEDKNEFSYMSFPRGAPFVAARRDLVAFAAAFPRAQFRAWAFGAYLHSQRQPMATLAQAGTTYVARCDEADAGRVMMVAATCGLSPELLADPEAVLPMKSPTCFGQSIWQRTCIAGYPI